jgi:hypothetical protein
MVRFPEGCTPEKTIFCSPSILNSSPTGGVSFYNTPIIHEKSEFVNPWRKKRKNPVFFSKKD